MSDINYIIIKYTSWSKEEEGMNLWRIVLCELPDNSCTPYVTWEEVKDENGETFFIHGEYCHTQQEAIDSYKRRVSDTRVYRE